MTWHTGPMLGFDLETTGVDVETARIVTASLVVVGDGDTRTDHYLIDPGIEIPAEAAAIHGITTDKARNEGMQPQEALGLVAHAIAMSHKAMRPLVAYNAAYDLTVLDRDLRRNGLGPLSEYGPVIDPFVIDRHVDPYRKGKRTLGVTCEHYRVVLDNAHDSTADALAALRLAWRMGCMYPEVGDTDPDALHTSQIKWHAERQQSFREYRERSGKDATDVSDEWPMRAWTG